MPLRTPQAWRRRVRGSEALGGVRRYKEVAAPTWRPRLQKGGTVPLGALVGKGRMGSALMGSLQI